MAETSPDPALHRSLTWPDVDPARNPFDRTAAAGSVRAILSAVPADADHGQRDGWRNEVSRLLVAAFGIWAREWCWSPSPGSWHGGRVAAWCCTKHSVASAEENQACVSASLLDWRDWLEELAERFDRLLPDPNLAPPDLLVAWEVAIADLAHAASGRMARDGWYGYFTWALCWLLNVAEIPVDIVQGTLHGTHMTRLVRSWPAPAISDINDMAEDVARLLVTYQTGVVLPRRDHLPDEWPPLRIR